MSDGKNGASGARIPDQARAGPESRLSGCRARGFCVILGQLPGKLCRSSLNGCAHVILGVPYTIK